MMVSNGAVMNHPAVWIVGFLVALATAATPHCTAPNFAIVLNPAGDIL